MDNKDAPEARGGTGPRAATRFLSFAISLAAVLGISLAIAWPLWSLASSSRRAYSLAFAAALAALIVLLAASRSRRRRSAARREAASP